MTQRNLPPRIAERPDKALWGPTELLTLPEAVALRWPSGPLSVKSLRNAIAKGQLGHVRIARKLFTTLDSLEEMCRCVYAAPARPDPPPEAPAPQPPSIDMTALLAEIGAVRWPRRTRAGPN